MAGLEVVVRPVVFPNIRPGPAQSLPPQDDPDHGFAVIKGNGALLVNTTNSWSMSASSSKMTETKRRVDTARVYQKDKDGTVNKDNFVDIEVANKMWMDGGAGFGTPGVGSGTPGAGGESTGSTAKDLEEWFFERVKEGDNIEVTERDKIIYTERR